MGTVSYTQSSFLGGVWSRTMQGRFDRPDYRTAMNVCLNGFPLDTGAWTRRPGSQFAGTTRGGDVGRILSFDFAEATPYSMEVTNGHIRFRNGPNLATTNDSQTIAGIMPASGNDTYTKLLLHCDSSFADSSTGNLTPTVHGAAAVSGTLKKFGIKSGYFPGSAGAYVSFANDASLDPAGDYTIDFWHRTNNSLGSPILFAKLNSSGFGPYMIAQNSSGLFFFSSSNGSTWDIANGFAIGTTPTTGDFFHVEVSRSGNTYRTFLNGVLGATWTSSATPVAASTALTIGAGYNGATPVFGYLDEVRFSNGIARHTAAFTPPLGSYGYARAQVVTTNAHGWTSGDQIFLTNLGTSASVFQKRDLSIAVPSANSFTLSDAITGATIADADLLTIPAGAVANRILDVTTPVTSSLIPKLRSVQAENKAVLLTGSTPQVLTATPSATIGGFASFTNAAAQFTDGPYLDPPTNGVLVTPSGVSGIVTLFISFAPWSATTGYTLGSYTTFNSINYRSLVTFNVGRQPDVSPTSWVVVQAATAISPSGFLPSDIGRHIRLFSEPAAWVNGASYVAGTCVKYNGAYWTAMTNHAANTTTAPGVSLTAWAVSPGAAVWTWGIVTGISTAISGTLAGSTNFVGYDNNGSSVPNYGNSPANAFDGVLDKTYAQASSVTFDPSSAAIPSAYQYIGKNYTSNPQPIGSVTVFPTSDNGLGRILSASAPFQDLTVACYMQLDLYASQVAPANVTDGTRIGTTGQISPPGNIGVAQTVTSTDTTTAWNYVWVAVTVGLTNGLPYYGASGSTWRSSVSISQVVFQAPNTTGVSGNGVTVQIMGPSMLYTGSIPTWRLGLFTADTWPTCGSYHEGRLWLSGAVANRLDGSKPNDIFNFAPTESNGTVTDASAISYTFNGPDANPIFWMNPDQQGIICGTQAGEWLVQASNLNSPLTPTSMQAHRVTTIGCANIEPRRTDHTLVFAQTHRRKVMEYFADVYSGKFSAPNLSLTAKHLSLRGVAEIAYQKETSPTIWVRCDDGSLIGATYKRDSLMSAQGPTFVAWHEHTLGSGRTVESICNGLSTDGLVDTLTMITNDPTTNVRHVEMLTPMPQDGLTLPDSWFLDDAIVPTATQSLQVGNDRCFRLFGLNYLNGKTVTVWAGGLDCGDYVVASGLVNVPFIKANALFTEAFVASFTAGIVVVVGFNYRSRGQMVRPATPPDAGTRMGQALGDTRRSNVIKALLTNTQGIYFGTSFTDAIGGTTSLQPARLTTVAGGGTAIAANALFSGVLWQPLTDGYTVDSMLCWEIRRPFPATIGALGATVQTQDQ